MSSENKQNFSGFNPIKETVDGKKAHSVIWSTRTLDIALEGLQQGRKLIANPFYENNTKLLKGDLVFQRTPEEEAEFLKCMNDIVYFANTYCKLMTPEGIKKVEMREYQREYLKHLTDHQLSIFLSCRQSGKCLTLDMLVDIHPTSDETESYISNLDTAIKVSDEHYRVPLFELIYMTNPDWEEEYQLYKEYYYTKDIGILSKIERLDLYRRNGIEKLQWSHILQGVHVLSDKGWTPSAYIHLTKPYEIYNIRLSDGRTLSGADEHLVFTEDGQTVWLKDLVVGIKLKTIDGIAEVVSIERQDYYVSMCDITVLNESESYYTNGILSHNTTTSAIFLLHYILFNIDKNTLVLGNKRRTAVEILDKLKKIFYEIPYFLKPGIYKWNESEIALDNGCRCMAEATTVNSGISFTFHCVLADEFAHIQPNILDKFYNQIFPTIVAGKAKFIISSTQNGFNLFQKLYTAAEEGENDYAPFRVDWWQVPEWNPDTHTWDKRDEAWHRRQAANLGGEEAFQAQFGTKFMVIANTLIDNVRMTQMMSESMRYVTKYLPGVICGDTYYFWRPDFEPTEDLRKNKIIVTIDLSEGVGRDSTVFMFWKCISDKKCECVGFFECPNIDLNKAAESLVQIINNFCSPDNTIVSMEYNTYGELFHKYLMEYIENGQVRFQDDIFVRYLTDNGRNSLCGLKINSHNKPVLCALFKQKFEGGEIINQSFQFMRQLENFSDVKNNGSYQAVIGHDDLVMASVQLVGVMDTLRFRDLVDSILSEGSDNNYDYYSFGQQNPWMTDSFNMMSRAQMQSDLYSGMSQDYDFSNANMRRLRNF